MNADVGPAFTPARDVARIVEALAERAVLLWPGQPRCADRKATDPSQVLRAPGTIGHERKSTAQHRIKAGRKPDV